MRVDVIVRDMDAAGYHGEAFPIPEDASRRILLDQAGAGTSLTAPDASRGQEQARTMTRTSILLLLQEDLDKQ